MCETETAMTVTATELKTNLHKYLTMVELEDIHITKNGKNIATLTSSKEAKRSALYSLVGIAKDLEGMDLKEARLSRQ